MKVNELKVRFQKEATYINSRNYDTIGDWAQAHMNQLAHDLYFNHLGKIHSYAIGDKKNGVWFFFRNEDNNEENSQYKQLPRKFKSNGK